MDRSGDVLDLSGEHLSSGEGRRVAAAVTVEPLELAGQRYVADPPRPEVGLDISRTTSGFALRIRYEVQLHGPCMRCLEEADCQLAVDAREVDQPGGPEELRSPYLDGTELDIGSWAREALVLAMPAKILCREHCLGLCPVCGVNINAAGPEHRHEPPRDSRWAPLDELRLE